MSNVIAFRHPATRPVPERPGLSRTGRTIRRAATPRRQVLVAEWRVNATDGRLECRWRSEGNECRDEDGSRRSRHRRAA